MAAKGSFVQAPISLEFITAFRLEFGNGLHRSLMQHVLQQRLFAFNDQGCRSLGYLAAYHVSEFSRYSGMLRLS